jgi:asparagine synthase (glutamine-hydrolysing)
VRQLLSTESIKAAGYFNPVAVARLLAKCTSSAQVGENDNMALVGVLSTQLWHEVFVHSFAPISAREHDAVVDVSTRARMATRARDQHG